MFHIVHSLNLVATDSILLTQLQRNDKVKTSSETVFVNIVSVTSHCNARVCEQNDQNASRMVR